MLVKNYFEEEKLANGFGKQKVIADFGKTVFIEWLSEEEMICEESDRKLKKKKGRKETG